MQHPYIAVNVYPDSGKFLTEDIRVLKFPYPFWISEKYITYYTLVSNYLLCY